MLHVILPGCANSRVRIKWAYKATVSISILFNFNIDISPIHNVFPISHFYSWREILPTSLLPIVVAVAATVLMYIYLNYSKQGYEISVVGESENTARYVGIKVEKVIIRTMLISGALCGLAGLLLVGGINHTITTTIADGQGFTAVMVSWMAKFNPFAMIFTSFLIILLGRGAGEISTAFGLNQSFADIITGIILFFIIGCEFFITYKISFRKKAGKEENI